MWLCLLYFDLFGCVKWHGDFCESSIVRDFKSAFFFKVETWIFFFNFFKYRLPSKHGCLYSTHEVHELFLMKEKVQIFWNNFRHAGTWKSSSDRQTTFLNYEIIVPYFAYEKHLSKIQKNEYYSSTLFLFFCSNFLIWL